MKLLKAAMVEIMIYLTPTHPAVVQPLCLQNIQGLYICACTIKALIAKHRGFRPWDQD